MEYIIDNKGVKKSVIVPYERWEKINSDYNKLKKKFEVFIAIRDGLVEIKDSKQPDKKIKTLSEFLNESNS